MPDKKPRLSVCMIVKNEESQLSRALDSVKAIADEIVVVDTGSQDRTMEIARSYGARVYEHPWQKDFALHRNQSINYATGDWVLILDADEELQSGHEELLAAIKSTDKDAVIIPVVSTAPQGHFESLHNSIRLLRASAGIRYSGAIHNQVDFDGPSHFVGARLFHYGYNLKRDKMLEKFERTTSMLLEQHQSDPQNPKYPYYLAMSYLSEEMFGETIIAADRAIELLEKLKAPSRLNWIGAYYARAAASVAMKDMQAAEHFARKALLLHPDYMDAQAILTAVYYTQKDSQLLRNAAERYLELHEKYQRDHSAFGMVPLHTVNQKTFILMRLAVDTWRGGPPEEAASWYQKALDSSSDFTQAVLSIHESLWREGMFSQALHVLEVAVERSDYNRRLMDSLVETYARLHHSNEAAAAIQRMENSGKSGAVVFELRARLAMLSGDFKTARDLYRLVVEAEADNTAARVRLGLASEGLGDNAAAERMFIEAIQLSEDPADATIHLTRLYSRMERWDEALKYLEPAMQKSTRRFDGLLMLARIYINLGQVDRLMELIYRLTLMLNIQLKSDTLDSAAELADILLEAARRLENFEQILAAEEAHVLACQMAPEKLANQFEYARFLTRFGRTRDSVTLIENLIRHHPDNREAFVVLAECYESMGAYDAAQMSRKRADELLNLN